MKLLAVCAVTLYLAIGSFAAEELKKAYPSLGSAAWKTPLLWLYWPVPLIKLNVDFIRQQNPAGRQWKGDV